MTRTLTSPAGEEVLVYSDQEWAELTGIDPESPAWGVATCAKPGRLAVLAVLWRDGPVKDWSGSATGVLADRALELTDDLPAFVRPMFTAQGFAPCIERDTRGKRTYSIRLVALPERWLPEVEHQARRRVPSALQSSIQTRSGDTGTEAPRQASVPTPAPDVLDVVRQKAAQSRQEAPGAAPAVEGEHRLDEAAPAVLEPQEPGLPEELAAAVATALLARVVEVLSKGVEGPQVAQLQAALDAAAERLGTQVDYAGKLRRDLRAAGDEVVALRQERDGLRERLRAAEHNLKVATSQDSQRIIDAEVRRQLDRMMRQAPTHRSAIDADTDRLVEATS
jgi:regulator of replication initiation timing